MATRIPARAVIHTLDRHPLTTLPDLLTAQPHRHHIRAHIKAPPLATTKTPSLHRPQEHHLVAKLTGISHMVANPTRIARNLLPALTADRTTSMGHNNMAHSTGLAAIPPSSQAMALLLTSRATELPHLVGINRAMAHQEASSSLDTAPLREDSTSKTTVQRRRVVIHNTLLLQASSSSTPRLPDINNRSLRLPDSSSSSTSMLHPLDSTSNILLRQAADHPAATPRRMVPQAASSPMASSPTSQALLLCLMVVTQAKEDMAVATKGLSALRRIFSCRRRRMHEFLCVLAH